MVLDVAEIRSGGDIHYMHTHPHQTRNSCSGWAFLAVLLRFHVVVGSVEIRGVALLAQGWSWRVSAGKLHVELVEVVIPVVVLRVVLREWVGARGLPVRGRGLRHIADCLPVHFVQGDDGVHGLDLCYVFSSCWSRHTNALPFKFRELLAGNSGINAIGDPIRQDVGPLVYGLVGDPDFRGCC